MLITIANLQAVFTNLRAVFLRELEAFESNWGQVAMHVPSTTRQETYGWLKELPGLREWIGDRVVKSLSTAGYAILNKSWEATIGVDRDDISDDQLGLYVPMTKGLVEAGHASIDGLVFGLLPLGFATVCHDGQYFFDSDHPGGPDGTWSNTGGGSGEPWFLLDVSKVLMPLIFQERQPLQFTAMDELTDYNVFMKKQFMYGVDARHNAGYGLPQLAYGSKQTLDATNYEAARLAMRSLVNDEGRPLNILSGSKKPLLVVGPKNEASALKLINQKTLATGEDNTWYGTAEVLVSGWIQ